MAKINAIVGTVNIDQPVAVFSSEHPPVFMTMEAKPGQTPAVIPAGTVVAKDSTGLIVPYDPAGAAPLNQPVGIANEEIDTTKETSIVVGVHGVAFRDRINVKGASATSADIDKLKNIGIYVR